MLRMIWVGNNDSEEFEREKLAATDLLVAFAVSTKHYLREEYGTDYPDLLPYLDHIPSYNVPSSTIPYAEAKLRSKSDPNNVPTNLPLEVIVYLSAFIGHQFERKRIDAPRYQALTFQLMTLTDCLGQLERILRSPIPLAYSIHLSQTVWLYLISLPFQLNMGWATIPLSAVTAAIFFGIESIGGEIENPFGYDSNDLPLDRFCAVIRGEVDCVVKGGRIQGIQDWVMHTGGDESKRTSRPVSSDIGTTLAGSEAGASASRSRPVSRQ